MSGKLGLISNNQGTTLDLVLTFQQALKFRELGSIVQLTEVLRFLREIFPGNKGISLMIDDI